MASTLRQKKVRVRPIQPSSKVADMTTAELRAMIEALIDRKLARVNPAPIHTARAVTTRQRQRAQAATGRFRSGRSDISVNHDEYLSSSYGQ